MPRNDDSGLQLPAGFCATIFVDNLGHARHLLVSPSGVVCVNTLTGDLYAANDRPPAGGFLVALQGKTGAGKASVNERFGETVQRGGIGGTGIALYKKYLYAEINDRIVRYALRDGSIVPSDPPVTILSGLPMDVPADEPGTEIAGRGPMSGTCEPWRHLAIRCEQGKPGAFSGWALRDRDTQWGRFRCRRNRPSVFVTQHGRDHLHSSWPDLYNLEQEATL
jgi:hypothetical protein